MLTQQVPECWVCLSSHSIDHEYSHFVSHLLVYFSLTSAIVSSRKRYCVRVQSTSDMGNLKATKIETPFTSKLGGFQVTSKVFFKIYFRHSNSPLPPLNRPVTWYNFNSFTAIFPGLVNRLISILHSPY